MKKFLIALFRDLIEQTWVISALIISWLVLEGSAKSTTLKLILGTVAIWMATFPFRYSYDHTDDSEE